MGTEYTVKFVNDPSTKSTWTMAIYQTIPNMGLFDNVIWKQGTAAVSGFKNVGWTIDYNVALADYFSQGDIGVLDSSQILPTDLGKTWEVVYAEGTQQLQSVNTPTPAGYINVINNSNLKANMGIGMSGSGTFFQRNAYSGTKAEFKVTPKYWAAIYNNVVIGEIVSTAVSATDPIVVTFPGGSTNVTLTAWVEGEKLFFGDKSQESGSVVSTPLKLVQARNRANDEAHAALAASQPQSLALGR